MRLLGAKPVRREHDYEIFLSSGEAAWADRFLETQGLSQSKLLGIHAGSGGTKNLALRRWPLASYIELIRQITRARPDVTVLVFGGPDEEKDNETILAQTDPSRVLRAKTATLCQAAALVGKCTAFLSVDTPFMHLAAAMNVPRHALTETPRSNNPITS